ncbi:MAG: carbohydrate ABC transporter permease [Clostridia bacterium]|nr:carbohydrate ABC transporter permease [Clostridia bacterium]
MKANRFLHGVLLSIVLLISLFWLMPLALIVMNSFKPYSAIFANFFALPQKISFEPYIKTWVNLKLAPLVFNTVVYAVSTALVVGLLAPMAAYKLGRVRNKVSGFITLLFVVPIMVPFTTYMISLSKVLGVTAISNTRHGYIIAMVGLNMPLAVYIVKGFVQTVPLEMEECATIDGAGQFRTFFSIVFPLLLPAISTVFVITALVTWGDIIVNQVVAGGRERSINIQTKLFMQFSKNRSDWEHAFPGIVISFIPSIVFFLFMQKYIVAGVTMGAVKG